MAENNRGKQPQHLTSVDIDISGVLESLRQVNEAIEKSSNEVGDKWANNINKYKEQIQSSFTESFGDMKALGDTSSQLKQIQSSYENLAKASVTAGKDGKIAKQSITVTESDGTKTVAQYKRIENSLKLVSTTQTKNAAKDKSDKEKAIRQLDTLIEKQTRFNNVVSSQKSSSKNREIIENNKQLISDMDKLKQSISGQDRVFKENYDTIDSYKKQIRSLGDEYQQSGTKGESFLNQVFDKSRWLSAFYIVDGLKEAFFNSIEVIKETEDAVVNLQRVLNNDSLSNNQVSQKLYDTAFEYGRSFEEVSEVSTRWAQAGYEWNEVIELTSGTMLALNTAELDVTQSTQGLIAIMKQWGFEVEDYATTIDKINITADNFAVTSETIVDALQRAGSTTKATNMSFEETIGVITALSEATGRSGEHIGVALNALAQYTSKSESLNIFAEIGSEAMKRLVDDYNKGAASIYDIWLQLAKDLESLSEQQGEALLKGIGFEDLATELQSAMQDAYGTAGTYRRSDFIAMLKDISTAEDVIKNMGDAAGYSESENEKYMQSLTASFEQLKVALRELAVQLGELGLLDILKGLTQLATGIVRLVKDIGGLTTALGLVAGVIVKIKAQKWAETILKTGDAAQKTAEQIGKVTTATKEASAASSALGAAFGWAGIAVTAISAVAGIYNRIKVAQQEARQATIEYNNETIEQSKNINSLISEYNELSSKTEMTVTEEERLAEINKTLTYELGERAKTLNTLKVGTEEYRKELERLNEQELENQRLSLASNIEQQRKELEEATKKWGGLFSSINISIPNQNVNEIRNIISDILEGYKQLEDYNSGVTTYGVSAFADLDEKLDYYAKLLEAEEKLKEFASESRENTELVAQSTEYQALKDIINSLKGEVESLISSMVQLEITDAKLNGTVPQTSEELDKFVTSVIYAIGVSGEYNDIIETLVRNTFPELARSVNEAGGSLDGTGQSLVDFSEDFKLIDENIKSLSSELSTFQTGLTNVYKAVDEFNKTGNVSLGTIQALINAGGEYLGVLDFTADGISINQQNLDVLVETQKENARAMVIQQFSAQALQIVETALNESLEDTQTESSGASGEINNLGNSILEYAKKCAIGEVSTVELTASILKLKGAELDRTKFDETTKLIDEFRKNMEKQLDMIDHVFSNTNNLISSTGSSAAKKAEEVKYEIDILTESIQKLSGAIDEAQSGINVAYDAMAEFNEQGYLSIDTIQAIVQAGGEYLSLLDFTSQGIQINKENLERLLGAQQNNINAMIQQGYAADVCRIAEQYLGVQLSQASVEAANANTSLASMNPTLAALTDNAWASANAAGGLANALANLYGKSLSTGNMAAFQRDLDASRNRWKSLLNEANRSMKNVNAVSSSAAKHSENQRKKASDAEKKALEAQKKALEEQKKAIKERYDAEIAALRKVEKENDRIRRKEEYYRNRQDALNDIERAATRSGVEYREQESEARRKLEDLDREWRETLEDWSIEDKISELEALRDAEIAAIDSQIQALSDKMSSISSETVSAASGANQEMLSNYGSEYLDPMKDNTLETTSDMNNEMLDNYNTEYIQPVEDLSKESYGNMSAQMQSDFSNAYNQMGVDFRKVNEQMLKDSYNYAADIYRAFDRNFFTPMRASIERVRENLSKLQSEMPSLPKDESGKLSNSITNSVTNNNITNNTNTNSNLFANLYGAADSKRKALSLFFKP